MNTMDPGIKPVWKGARVVGPVFTARCLPESIITVHKALLEAPKGSVIRSDEYHGSGDQAGLEGRARRGAGVHGPVPAGEHHHRPQGVARGPERLGHPIG